MNKIWPWPLASLLLDSYKKYHLTPVMHTAAAVVVLLLLTAGISRGREMRPFQTVSLGISGPGAGPAIMGHAFIAFHIRGQRTYGSEIFQFSVDLMEESESEQKSSGPIAVITDLYDNVSDFLGYGKRFVLAHYIDATAFFNIYTMEERAIYFFALS